MGFVCGVQFEPSKELRHPRVRYTKRVLDMR